MRATGRVTAFSHGGITVKDTDEGLRFYRDGPGLEIAFEGESAIQDARIAEMGFRSRVGEVETIEDGPHAGSKVAYLVDPDGHHVECYEKALAAPDIVATLQTAGRD